MSLELTEEKILADGVHDATLDEVEKLFGTFQRTDRRSTLFAKLREYLDALQAANMTGWLVIDGSFIMGCIDSPEDIDVVLILSKGWDMTQDLRPQQYNLVSKRDVKREYPFDLYPVREGSNEEAKWLEFFSQVNVKWYDEYSFAKGSTKGLVRVAI